MAYIGKSIESGTFSVLDTSGNTYNGSNTTFNLGTQVGSVAQLLVSHDGVIQKPGTDYTLASGGTQITFTTAPASGASIFIVEISGAVGGPLDADLNGTELILDADGDTSLHASTDDQIDIKIAGADDFQFTANTFTAQSGSTITTPTLGVGTARDQGVLHVRTADTSATAGTDSDELVLENSAAGGLTILGSTTANGKIAFGDSDDSDAGAVIYEHNGNNLRFHTNGSEKVRIDSSGNVGLGVSTMGGKLHVERSDNAIGIKTSCTSASYDSTVTLFEGDRNTSNNSYSIIQGKNGGGMTFQVQDSGNVLNTNNSYGSLSDSRVKQDIDDASSQWDDIKALKIRKFKLKKYVNRDGADNTPYHLGVIAQELEASGMNGLVEENKPEKEDVALSSDFGTVVDGTADNGAVPIIDDDGNITGYEDVFTAGQNKKEVKYSILYMKAIKALQEAMAKIESLEARVTTLEG
jgi:hypothetical protein